MTNTLTAQIAGKNKVFALWPTLSQKTRHSEMARSVADAAVKAATDLDAKRREVAVNEHLTDAGKAALEREVAAQSVASLVKLQAPLEAERKALEAAEAAAAGKALEPRDKSDIAGTLIDLALAQKVAELDRSTLSAALQMGGQGIDPDLLRVAATMPTALTGLTQEQRAAARTAAIVAADPAAAQSLKESREAIAAADQTIAQAWKIMTASLDRETRKNTSIELFRRYDDAPEVSALEAAAAALQVAE